jgi:sortase A
MEEKKMKTGYYVGMTPRCIIFGLLFLSVSLSCSIISSSAHTSNGTQISNNGTRTPSSTPLITAVVLPSGHTPPTSPGGAAPNDDEVPANLRPLMQSYQSLAIPTRGPEQPLRLDLPSLNKITMPVVEGDGWEQLKQGVGHHIGSANPGTAGNVVLSAHDDIYGELFRDLDWLKPGDEAILYTATQKFFYRVVTVELVDPTDVSIMGPTVRPTLTLISCYPYMVDTQRIVVTAELEP